jgi:hypothetical protein
MSKAQIADTARTIWYLSFEILLKYRTDGVDDGGQCCCRSGASQQQTTHAVRVFFDIVKLIDSYETSK